MFLLINTVVIKSNDDNDLHFKLENRMRFKTGKTFHNHILFQYKLYVILSTKLSKMFIRKSNVIIFLYAIHLVLYFKKTKQKLFRK